MSLAHRLYRLFARLLTPTALLWLGWRALKEPDYAHRLGERLGFVEVPPQATSGLLLHAASVGEVQAARPLIEALLRDWPEYAITVSTMTPTGAKALHAAFGGRIRHVFLPLDTPGATSRFLNVLAPTMLILIEREVWPELLLQCRLRGVPVALVSARLSEKSAQTYQRLHRLFGPVWRQLAWVATADPISQSRYVSLGVPASKCTMVGNLKFDQADAQQEPYDDDSLTGRFVVVAGSTHEAEEEALLTLWPALFEKHPPLLLVLVPRHPQRFDQVASRLRSVGLPWGRLSEGTSPKQQTAIWLVDAMGQLPHWYSRADVCFIGGSLQPVGGHNPLEAMVHGRPVLYGPHTQNFESLYAAMDAQEAGWRVDSAKDLVDVVAKAMTDPELLRSCGERARALVLENQGATRRMLGGLAALWNGLQPSRLRPIAVSHAGPCEVWFDPAKLKAPAAEDFRLEHHRVQPDTLATGSGRGQVHVLDVDSTRVVLRHYRRGGLIAKISRDRFWGTQARHSRAMKEYLLLRRMTAWNLPVPSPVAALCHQHGPWQSADIMVQLLPGTRNLVQRLSEQALPAQAWEATGRAIRRMHDQQVDHTDLNAHNLLLDDLFQAWIVDFDKCTVRTGDAWKQTNLARLLRSLRKESQRLPSFCWQEAEWQILINAYSDKALSNS